MTINRELRLLSLIAALAIAAAESAAACSAFCVELGGHLLVGKSYDWSFDEGMIVVNKRGHKKASFVYAGESRKDLATWTSRYGSVSFVQYGREIAFVGMNEAGLVAHEQWLEASRYPQASGKPSISIDQVVQYMLDTCGTVGEVQRAAPEIRIRPTIDDFTKVHFFFTDASGECLSVDCIEGKLVCRSKLSMPVKALTNDTYDDSLRFFRAKGLPDPAATTSPARFSRIAAFLSSKPKANPDQAVSKAFELLDSVRQQSTVFQAVFDIRERVVYFKSRKNRSLRYFNIDKLDFSPHSESKMLDLNGACSGDVASNFLDYRTQANEELIRRAWTKLGFIRIVEKDLRLISRYPESFKIDKSVAAPFR